jgi:glycosyltransferase involved in cell wall biosynthesis
LVEQAGTEPSILFVTRKWPPATGGMETYSVMLTAALAAEEPVEVVALPGRADGMPPAPAQLLAFPLTVLRRAFASRSAPRVLHLGDMALWPLAALALFWRGTRVVLSAHGTDVAYHRRGGIRGTLYGAYLKIGARLLPKAQVIANSQATVRVAAETGWHRAVVVPLATEPSQAALSDGTHDGTILFVGRLVERKGCGWFIREVLPLLPQGTRLLVAGTAWDEKERAALAAPGVEFLGPVRGPNLTELYRRAKCVIVPNVETSTGEYEGFGLVAPEAAAAGGLVLAARCDGLVDAVIEGTTGLLAESGNALAWAECIRDISGWDGERRRSFLTRAQAAAADRYCWSRVARETRLAYGLDERLEDADERVLACPASNMRIAPVFPEGS